MRFAYKGRSVSSTTAAHMARITALERKQERFGKTWTSPEGRSPERSEGEWVRELSMSAFRPEADEDRNKSDVRNVPGAVIKEVESGLARRALIPCISE
jgi:hypothetical protein